MRQHPENPPSNNLSAGVTDDDMLAAIQSSGYCLQSVAVDTIIASAMDILDPNTALVKNGWNPPINCQEEWSYIDDESQATRQLDALISIDLTSEGARGKMRPATPADTMRFHLDLLIECKQSDLPFVLFARKAAIGEFPNLIGLPHYWLSVKNDDDRFTYRMSMYDTLHMFDLPLANYPETAISMSKAHRKGKSIELSGEDAFRGIALPLTKALRYYTGLTQTDKPRLYSNIRFTIPLAVIRAPMVVVGMKDGLPQLAATPWTRLVRFEPSADSPFLESSKPCAIDVVHIDFLERYVKIAIGSCLQASRRMAEFAIPCLTGEALGRMPAEKGDAVESAISAEPGAQEEPAYVSMRPLISKDHFMREWIGRFRAAHAPEDGSGPQGKPIFTIRHV